MKIECISISLDCVDGINPSALASRLVEDFKEKGMTVASAESCTGGLFGSEITAISGASDVYLGGVISYTNEVKERVLGVDSETLEKHTAVSAEVALEMARGVRALMGAELGVSVTGYAGPTGGDDVNPVGTVFVCISGEKEENLTRLSFDVRCGRENIRKYSVCFMLSELLKK